jgi:ferredoxin
MKQNNEKPFLLFKTRGTVALRAGFLNPTRGMQSLQESANICNRCGACNQKCPSYRVLNNEIHSPRGRNQLLRLFTDRRISACVNKKDILAPVLSCIMCGACTAACGAAAPAAKHMGEIKNALGMKTSGFLRETLLNFFAGKPGVHFVFKNLKYKIKDDTAVKVVYLPDAHGLKYAKNTLALLRKELGGVYTLKSSLLLGAAALTQNTRALKKILGNIKAEYEKILSSEPLPIVTDNIEDYRALKTSPEYGTGFEPLAAAARFITDYLKPFAAGEKLKNKRIIIQNNNVLFCGDEINQKTAALFVCRKDHFLVELEEGAHALGLLAYEKAKGAPHIKKNLAALLAKKRADIIITCSAREENMLNGLLKQYYPGTKALHIAACGELFYD